MFCHEGDLPFGSPQAVFPLVQAAGAAARESKSDMAADPAAKALDFEDVRLLSFFELFVQVCRTCAHGQCMVAGWS